jgi:hypothetical protein
MHISYFQIVINIVNGADYFATISNKRNQNVAFGEEVYIV